MKEKSSNKTSVWLVIGALVLIILLILWLTFADLAGDTDVAAYNTLAPAHDLLKTFMS